MRHIFEAMKRIEATRIIEADSDELFLIIEALSYLHNDWRANGEDSSEIDSLLARIVPLRAVNETPLLYNELVDRQINRELKALNIIAE